MPFEVSPKTGDGIVSMMEEIAKKYLEVKKDDIEDIKGKIIIEPSPEPGPTPCIGRRKRKWRGNY